MFIEIHLSQIRISDSKREKICAVCPCLLFDSTVSNKSAIEGALGPVKHLSFENLVTGSELRRINLRAA